MSQEYVQGKRYPRKVQRRDAILKGLRPVSSSCFDLGRTQLNNSEAEYNKRLAQLKKMANVR